MSLQVAITLVLSVHPNGRATLAAMNSDIAVLAGAGPAWNSRLGQMAARIPDLAIFSQKLVVRDAVGWAITVAGREAILRMQARAATSTTPIVPSEAIFPPISMHKLTVAEGSKPSLPAAITAKQLAGERRRSPR